jgi:NAD(P)-dependent dehydrogenase (short-subunit alcohol dehydrogenase family)
MNITLEGRVALITGAGAGIGHAIAKAFADIGAKIVIAEIDEGKCEALRQEFGPDALVVQTDVRDTAQVEALKQALLERHDRLDVLVNNVGHHLGIFKPITEMTEEEWDLMQDINLRQMFIVSRAMIPLMRGSEWTSSIINISSIEGFRGCPYNVSYTTAKHAVTGFTRALSIELANDRIRVNLIAPETTDTEQVPLAHAIRPGYEDHANRTLPIGRFGRPEDHANAAVYLATDMSSWVTGTEMFVDGGSHTQNIFKRKPNGTWTVMAVVEEAASYD